MSTSKLQRQVSELLSTHLGQYTIRENIRPDWLVTPEGARLELDFYIEELEVAIEVQGQQHYVYTPYFHQAYDGFIKQLKRDRVKQRACQQQDIELVEIDTKEQALETILQLANKKRQYLPHPNAIKQGQKRQPDIKEFVSVAQGLRDLCQNAVDNKYFKSKGQKERARKQLRLLQRCYSKKAWGLIKDAERIIEENPVKAIPAKERDDRIPPLPGTNRARTRSRELECKQIDSNTFIVWGGESEHTVTFDCKDDHTSYKCDCSGYSTAKDNMCSHNWCVYNASRQD